MGTTPTAKFDQGDRSSAIHWIVFDFLGGDYLTDGGVCGIDERSVLGDADCLLCITSLQRHVDKRVLVGLEGNSVSHILPEGGHLDDNLISTGLQKGNDVLAGAIGLRSVDCIGARLGDRYLSVFDYGAGCIGDRPRDRPPKFLSDGVSGEASWKQLTK